MQKNWKSTFLLILVSFEVLACSTSSGNKWQLPAKAGGPQPPDGAINVLISTTLSWGTALRATSYDIYFGDDYNTVLNANYLSPEFKGNQTATSYDPPGDLNYLTTYYWRIDTVNAYGTTVGTVWSFTTEELPMPNTICVSDADGDDTNNGTNWARAVKTIQKGLDLAGNIGWTVIVADGTYRGTGNKDLNFAGKEIQLRSQNGATNCIIDCETSGRGFNFENGETSQSIVDGFTIRNGSVGGDEIGGAVRASGTSPTITNCIMTNNSAYCGGAVGCNAGSNITLTNCTLTSNTADDGAGIYFTDCSFTVTNCTVSNNNGNLWGGGISCTNSSGSITNCTLSGNHGHLGGGISCNFSSSVTIVGCTITNNVVPGGAGCGIVCADSSPTIRNCVITGNSSYSGAGISCVSNSSPTIVNCLIANNSAAGWGAGIGCYNSSSPTIINCTIAYNSAVSWGGGMGTYNLCTPAVSNTIFWGNTAPNYRQIGVNLNSPATLNYCDCPDAAGEVGGDSAVTRNNCITSNPQFTNSGSRDYSLLSSSPCIDAGNNAYIPAGVTTDVAGNARVVDGNNPPDGTATVDIGAYEYQP